MMIYAHPCFNLGLEFMDGVDGGNDARCVPCWRPVLEMQMVVWCVEERERGDEMR